MMVLGPPYRTLILDVVVGRRGAILRQGHARAAAIDIEIVVRGGLVTAPGTPCEHSRHAPAEAMAPCGPVEMQRKGCRAACLE